jgi:bisanhydrobacterioruberin hydratase
MSFIRNNPRFVIGFLGGFYLIGAIGLSLDLTREIFRSAVPYTLLLSLLFLSVFHEEYTPRFLALAAFIYFAGLIVEMVGVATGKIFGYYDYGHTLGLQVLDTPLLIGMNWLTLSYMVWVFLSDFQIPRILIMILGPAVMVLYDLVLEPVAVWTDMWTWGGEVPLQNYIAWFVISIVFFMLIGLISPVIKNKIAPALFIIQLGFFLVLNIIMKLLT